MDENCQWKSVSATINNNTQDRCEGFQEYKHKYTNAPPSAGDEGCSIETSPPPPQKQLQQYEHLLPNASTINQTHGSSCSCCFDFVSRAARVVSFIDLAGHHKYLKTTLQGLMGRAPDYTLLCVSAQRYVIVILLCCYCVVEY